MARFTVGSLRGIPQGRAALPPHAARSPSALGALAQRLEAAGATGMPRARRCCRSGCAGCPWTEAQRLLRARASDRV